MISRAIGLIVEIDSILENITSEKVQLMFSDEKLLSYYALGEGEKMVKLAQESIALCEKFQHTEGIYSIGKP